MGLHCLWVEQILDRVTKPIFWKGTNKWVDIGLGLTKKFIVALPNKRKHSSKTCWTVPYEIKYSKKFFKKKKKKSQKYMFSIIKRVKYFFIILK